MSADPMQSPLRRLHKKYISERFSREHWDVLRRLILEKCDSLLDVGCGAWSPISDVSKSLRHVTGLDVHEPYLAKATASGRHHDYILGNALDLDKLVVPRSYDAVIALDLIEHLEKAQGLKLMQMMEDTSRKMVAIFTPNGFLPQAAYHDNPFQEHLSGWHPSDFYNRGYDVYGCNGVKWLRGERGRVRWRPASFWRAASHISQPFIRSRPKFAFQLLAIKNTGALRDGQDD